jgi:hypothetical protein
MAGAARVACGLCVGLHDTLVSITTHYSAPDIARLIDARPST